jgi:arylesterase/paraoxonase
MSQGVFGKSSPKNGELYLYDYSRPRASLETIRMLNTPSGYSFHPLGLSLHLGTNTLLAVNHGTSGSTIDQFHFSRLGNSATYIKSFSSEYLRAPNAVLQISDTEVLVTNDHFFTPLKSKWLNKIETYLGLPLGGVSYLDLKSGVATQVARIGFANGIAMLNSTTVAVASSSAAKVLFYTLDKSTSPPTLTYTESISTPFWPDNLHTSGSKLFIAGHASLSGLTKFSESRKHCGTDTKSAGCNAVAPSYVAQWTREKGIEDVYVGTEIYASSGIGIDEKRGVGVVSGLYGKGLLIWGEEKK